jgi:hypothetical protein
MPALIATITTITMIMMARTPTNTMHMMTLILNPRISGARRPENGVNQPV